MLRQWRKKNETWKEIAKRYNANHGITRRHHLQLKKCWNNLKQKWKEEAAREKRERHKTGKNNIFLHDWFT